MNHNELIAALRATDGLRDVGSDDHPDFHFRSRPFLHFHEHPDGTYADVLLGTGGFVRVWVSTPTSARSCWPVCRNTSCGSGVPASPVGGSTGRAN
jgi:hypothetical protein